MLRPKTRWLAARMAVGLGVTILAMLVAASGCSAPSGGPGGTWVTEPFSLSRGDNQPGTACADGSPLSIYGRRSPSGDWQLHPAFDGHGGLCISSQP